MLRGGRHLFISLVIMLFVLARLAESQLSSLQHEPDLEWQTMKTEHFWIHFPAGFEQLGVQVGTICEQVYEPISVSLDYFPGRTHVVVHTRVDSPEGATSYLPWRMELYVTEPQGNIVGSGDDWLKVVIAHEFTHIVHLRKRRGFSAFTYPFLGDFNAFWQQMAPMWFSEGVATLNETRYSLGGRGRTPFHWMQMAATVRSRKPWRLEDTNYGSRKRMPGTRMRYVSGYYLTRFIDERYGPDTWARILDRYSAFPMLGFSKAVKWVTGATPKRLYGEMLNQADVSARERNFSPPPARLWRKQEHPEDQYSPRWMDDEHILIYRKSFDELQELAVLDRSGNLERIKQRALAKVENGFTIGNELLIWAELHPHPRFSATILSDLKLYDRKTGKREDLTHNARIYSPDLSPDKRSVVAIQTSLPTSRLVTVTLENGKVQSILEVTRATLLNPRWSPDGAWVAFALKDSNGVQDIAVLNVEAGRWRYLYPPDIHHDNNPCWTPDGRFVLYTSDRSGIFNIWAVELSTGRRWMVTNAEFGAFAPDVSPHGNELAFSSYTDKGFSVATMPLDSMQWLKEAALEPQTIPLVPATIHPTGVRLPSHSAQISDYRSARQIIRPQGWLPLPVKDDSGINPGLFAVSEDVLHRQAWQGVLYFSQLTMHPWGVFSYTNHRHWAAFRIQAHTLPEQISVNGATGWWSRQGLQLAWAVPLVLEKNVYTTVLRPSLTLKGERWRHSSGTIYPRLQDYRGVRLGFTFGRTGQAPRDIVPHRAGFVSAFADWSSSLLGSDFTGRQVSIGTDLFLPTLILHHQIELLGMYQNRRGNFDYDFYGALPLGYDDDFRHHQLRFRLAYVFPLAYLELPVPILPVWIDYTDAAPFYDWGLSWNKQPSFRDGGWSEIGEYSAGLQLSSVNYLFQVFRVRLGVAVYYHSKDQDWKTTPIIELSF